MGNTQRSWRELSPHVETKENRDELAVNRPNHRHADEGNYHEVHHSKCRNRSLRVIRAVRRLICTCWVRRVNGMSENSSQAHMAVSQVSRGG